MLKKMMIRIYATGNHGLMAHNVDLTTNHMKMTTILEKRTMSTMTMLK